jgi:hypothetical protein
VGGNTSLLKVQSVSSEPHCCFGFREVEVQKGVYFCVLSIHVKQSRTRRLRRIKRQIKSVSGSKTFKSYTSLVWFSSAFLVQLLC